MIAWVCDVGIPELEHEMSHLGSEVFTSTDHRVVVVSRWRSEPRDPSAPPEFYVRRPPQSWDFSPVDR